MSDEAQVRGRIGQYKDWFNERFRKPDGSCYGDRARQNITRRIKPPIIKNGWSQLIDFDRGDDRLRELALHREPERRGRGRPRAIDTLK